MKHVFYEHIETLNRQPWGQWRWSTPRNIRVSKFKYYQCGGGGGLGYYFPGYRAGVITISWSLEMMGNYWKLSIRPPVSRNT